MCDFCTAVFTYVQVCAQLQNLQKIAKIRKVDSKLRDFTKLAKNRRVNAFFKRARGFYKIGENFEFYKICENCEKSRGRRFFKAACRFTKFAKIAKNRKVDNGLADFTKFAKNPKVDASSKRACGFCKISEHCVFYKICESCEKLEGRRFFEQACRFLKNLRKIESSTIFRVPLPFHHISLSR